MGHPIYHLEAEIQHGRIEIQLNGFPVLSLRADADTPATFAPPINPWLVGELNILDVTILPIPAPGGEPSTFGDARVSGSVRRFEKGDIVSPGAGELVTEFTIPDELKERVREEELLLPQSFSHVFGNDVIDFSAELQDAPVWGDRAALIDYAMHLSDLALRRDVTALLAEHAPKIRAWAKAYDEPEELFGESLRTELSGLFDDGDQEPASRADVELVPWCGERIWELRRASGGALVRTVPDASGGRSQLPIFVGAREGRLRVVR